MACFWYKSNETHVKIPSTEEKDGVIFYKIQVDVADVSWHVIRRYNDFFELHTRLINDHGVAKDILPSKKIIRSKSPEFIETRRLGLEVYLQKLIKFLTLTMPRIFLEFLDFHLYDIFFLLQTLSFKFYSEADVHLSTTNAYSFNALEMHAISKCCNLPIPPKNNNDKRYDLSHALDFCSQLRILHVSGITGTYLESNIKPNELSFDFKSFRRVNALTMNEVSLESIKDLGQFRNNLTNMTINKAKMINLHQILQCDVLHKYDFDSSQIWSSLVLIDLSHNCLTDIDQTIYLVPNLEVLILDQNRFSCIPNLSNLNHLKTLSMSGNLITSCLQLPLSLGNILHLNLSHNSINSLSGFAKLYSLESLNLTGNHISNMEEMIHLSKLPCLEDLKLTGNNVSTVVDYRIKVLEFFGTRAEEICLDNEQASQPEIDKVSIRRALKILKEGSIPNILTSV